MPKTILCVDDSVTMQKVAEITFHATEYQYVGAKNADEGLAAARKERPALILVDAVMPGRTGYDLCAALKADADLKDVPVLLMCGNSQAYDPARGSQVGADGHVIKPWDTQVMLDKVAEVLGSGAKAASPAAGATAPAPRAPAHRPAAASGPDRSGSSPASPAGMNKAPGAKPPSSPFSSPPARPAPPASLSQPEPPRSATIMGMPSLKLPPTVPQGPQFSAPTPVSRPEPPAISRSAPPVPEPRGAARSGPPIPPPNLGPPPRSVSRSPSPAPVSAGPPATAAPTPAAPSHPAIPTMPRPPMIKGTPTRRPNLSAIQGGASGPSPSASPRPARSSRPDVYDEPTRPRSSAALEAALSRANSATADAAGAAARSAGLDPDGPEMAALLELSRDVIERVVWEVVPDLAEAIIRENLDKLTAKAR